MALACELNKALNNCLYQEYPLGCTVASVCVELGYSTAQVHSSLLNILPNTNPFRYCSADNPCDGLSCNGETNPIRHVSMSIVYIDSIAQYIKNNAPSFECPTGYSFRPGTITVGACKLDGHDCADGTPCWDTHLKIKYEIVCCPAF